jgi:hypothetical protein
MRTEQEQKEENDMLNEITRGIAKTYLKEMDKLNLNAKLKALKKENKALKKENKELKAQVKNLNDLRLKEKLKSVDKEMDACSFCGCKE